MAVASKAWERVVWGNGEMQNSAKLDLIDSCNKRELGASLRIETRNETRDIHEARYDQELGLKKLPETREETSSGLDLVVTN